MTEQEQKDLLVEEVGEDEQKPGRLATNVDVYWDRRVSTTTAAGSPRHLLLVKKDLILLAMGLTRSQVNFRAEGDVSFDATDRMDNLRKMLEEVKAELAELDAVVPITETAGVAAFAAGELETTGSTSMVRPYGAPNANSLRFRGSPYRPNKVRP